MKRIFIFWIGLTLLGSVGVAEEGPLAVLYKKNGQKWRYILLSQNGASLQVRTEKLKEHRTVAVEEIDWLDIQVAKYDEMLLQQRFNEADYAAIVTVLEPIVLPSADFMGIPNNLQDGFNLLMRTYCENGDTAKAREASARLMKSPDPELKCSAQVCRVRSALAENDLQTAEAVLAKISDPAAALYARACVERARQTPEIAIQTAVQLIAEHPNNLDWMPLTELLCAELYLEMGRPDSAEAAARQTQKLYAGTNIEKKAQALHTTIEQLPKQPEE